MPQTPLMSSRLRHSMRKFKFFLTTPNQGYNLIIIFKNITVKETNTTGLNPFLTRFLVIISLVKTLFFDNSTTLKTVLICVSRINWMCLTKTSVVQ